MNYGKEGAKKQAKKLAAKSPRILRKFKVVCYKLLLVAAFAFVVAVAFTGFGVYKGIIDSSPTIDAMDVTPTGYLSTVLDTEGNTTATLVASGANRVYVTIDEIPEDLQHAFVAIEDERFYEHNGIDVKGIIRAGVKGILSGGHFSQGASTITQQLLKNNVFTTWTTDKGFAKVVRKLQEQYLAVELEKKVNNKDWILENYLNTVNLGQNSLGVQAAAMRYFNKDVSELTLSECAVIAGITKSPEGLNPISHPEANAERREEVLEKMEKQGYITEEQKEKALKDKVYKRIKKVNIKKMEENSQINSYFVDELTNQVLEDLQTMLGYTKAEAYKALYNSGLTICSTQDPKIQAICDEEVNNLANYPTQPQVSFNYRLSVQKPDGTLQNYDEHTMLAYYQAANNAYDINFATEEEAWAAIEAYKAEIMEEGDIIPEGGEYVNYTLQPQAALTIIDQATGEVKAIVGGRGDKVANRTLNRATDSTRQPGSTFKVLAAYAPALDGAGMTLATVEDDAPYEYANGTSLKNYDNRYRGFTDFRTAITYSINVVTVKCLTDIGVDNGYSYLQDFGFTTLKDSDHVQSLALGGLTNGVTNLELTAAYAAIANQGTYTKPRFYTKILDHDGNVLIDNTPQTKSVLKDTTAWLLTDAMKDVITTGTGKLCNFSGMTLAGKSGTTTKNRDALFAGYSPYYTCVVWGGYDDNTPQASGTTSYPKLIWKAVMQRLHEGLEDRDFEKPSDIVECTVCKKSGLLAKDGLCNCDPRGSQVTTEYFAAGTEPTEYCDKHVAVTICEASGKPAGSYCPQEGLKTKAYISGGSAGTEDAPYLLPANLSTDICPVHSVNDVAPVDITGETGGEDDLEIEEDDSGEEDEPSDSHTGLEYEEQMIIYPDEISE
ncbi:MAG: PBP1A family penicillin-binding protein [Lachnospiraceae bacterium]|nr:PBP1A family penicillin-binding protein [bacterium]MDY5516219.1 PBP1A family penicillin-binding protein [Lachnospiraceae bacterium]